MTHHPHTHISVHLQMLLCYLYVCVCVVRTDFASDIFSGNLNTFTLLPGWCVTWHWGFS